MTNKLFEIPSGEKGPGNIIDETVLMQGGSVAATTPTFTLDRNIDTSTNTAPEVLHLKRQTTGSPANGIGAGLGFVVETGAGNMELGAIIQAVARDVTAGSEDFDLVVKLMTAGAPATEIIRIRNALFGAAPILLTNGADTVTFGPLGNFNSTLTALYGLQIKAGDGASVYVSGPSFGQSPLINDHNAMNISRFGLWFARHAGGNGTNPYVPGENFIKTDIHTSDEALTPLSIRGQACFPTATVNTTGGTVNNIAGDGPSGGNGNGGPNNVAGGKGYGSGTDGDLNLSYSGAARQGNTTVWGNLNLKGNLATAIRAVSADTTYTADDCMVEFDATGAACTGTLPAVATAKPGTIYFAVKADASANPVTLDGNASETINGATTLSTTTQWAVLRVKRNAAGTAWIAT